MKLRELEGAKVVLIANTVDKKNKPSGMNRDADAFRGIPPKLVLCVGADISLSNNICPSYDFLGKKK
jgi:hypothetical protein